MYKQGKHDIKILKEIVLSKDGYFSISRFSSRTGISKGTIKPALVRLLKYRLISKPQPRTYKILSEGEFYLSSKVKKLGNRAVVRKQKFKSIHSVEVYIETYIKNINILIEKLNPLNHFKSYPKNWVQHNLEFEDGSKITIKPNTTTLNIPECSGKTWEECDNRVRDKVFDWIKRLENQGVMTFNVYVNYSHFADINSTFSKEIEKRLGSYELKNKNGITYWIDYSTGDLEGETDQIKTREGVDSLITEASEGYKLSDIDPIKLRLSMVENILEKLTISHKNTTESLENQTKILELTTKQPTVHFQQDNSELKNYTG